MCLKIHQLDPTKFVGIAGLTLQGALKKTKVKLELLTDIDMLLVVKKGIGGGMSQNSSICKKKNNYKFMKNYDKNEELPYLKYRDSNNLYGWEMSQRFPVNNFELIEDTPQFNEEFIKNYNE